MGYRKPGTQPVKQPVKKKKTSKKKRSKAKIIALSLGGLLVLVVGGILLQTTVSAKNLTNQAKTTQEAVMKDKTVKLSTTPEKDGSYAYGADNDGIPNASQLKEYQADTTPMTT